MNQAELDVLVARERTRLPSEVLHVPSMLAYEERGLLHWAGRHSTDGAIVDAGCFLGGSTLSLGFGVRAKSAAPYRTRIHSYDFFLVGEERERAYFPADFPFAVGADTLALFERYITPIRGLVEVHRGDLNYATGFDAEIDVLFIDIAKSWATNDAVLERFFSHLRPGSIVIQQDLVHFGHPWCAMTMELLAEHFELLGFVPFSSAVYRTLSTPPAAALPFNLMSMSADDAAALITRAANRFVAPYDGYLRLAIAILHWFHGDLERAGQVRSDIGASYADAELPWFDEHLAYVDALLAQAADQLEP